MKIKNPNKQPVANDNTTMEVLLWLNELRLRQEAFCDIPLAVTHLVVTVC